MSKMNENPATKMQVMLQTMRCKPKMLKYNCFLYTFGRYKIACAPHHRNRRTSNAVHFAKKSGHEQAFRNRAPTQGIMGDTIGG